IVPCPKCGVQTALSGTNVRPGNCGHCRAEVARPATWGEDPTSCYKCLRAGRAAFAHDTVLGMVTWEQAMEGLTHGVPGLRRDDFELVPSEDDPEWMRARVPGKHLLELVRTPTYITWQGEQWQFCCGRPMIYLGELKETDFERRAPDGDGRALLG